MSMEQAILEHAGALRELAAAVKSMGDSGRVTGFRPELAAPYGDEKVAEVKDAVLEQAIKDGAESARAEVVKADKKVPNDETIAAMKEAEQIVANREKADAELEAAVSKVEEESKAIDYKTDVRPVLLALAKKAGQPALKDLLTKYGAATGDKLTADQFAGIVADANALIAG
jgi:lipopolysaccharide biosynthesis regulator YciM